MSFRPRHRNRPPLQQASAADRAIKERPSGKTMKRLIALAILWAATGILPAFAAEWHVIAQSKVGNLAVERTMLKRHGTHVLGWMRELFNEPQTTPVTGDKYDMLLDRVEIDCANDTVSVLSSRSTLKDQTVGANDVPLPAGNIEPDSTMYLVENAVCR